MKQHICYSATHVPTGLQYIGYTSHGLEHRKAQHINGAKRISSGKEKPNSLLAIALSEWGADDFEWKIEAEGGEEEMKDLEEKLIESKQTLAPFGFNSRIPQRSLRKEAEKFEQEFARIESEHKDRIKEHRASNKDIEDILLRYGYRLADEIDYSGLDGRWIGIYENPSSRLSCSVSLMEGHVEFRDFGRGANQQYTFEEVRKDSWELPDFSESHDSYQ